MQTGYWARGLFVFSAAAASLPSQAFRKRSGRTHEHEPPNLMAELQTVRLDRMNQHPLERNMPHLVGSIEDTAKFAIL